MLEQPVRALAAALRARNISASTLIEEAEDRHARLGEILNAYIAWDADGARKQALLADGLFALGADLGLLQGLPVSVKDLFGVRGFRTYAGSPRPLPEKWEEEGPLIRRLRRQVPAIIGKTHTVEFAIGGLGTNRHYGPPRNPWDAGEVRVSGGSSSGAGVSLQEGSAVLALGSDTSGSVRMPASMTGCVGVKLSRGRWPAGGIVPVSETLDSPGLLTRSVDDLVAGFCAIDLGSPDADDMYRTWDSAGVSGLRIGVPDRLLWDACDPGIAEGCREALGELERRGALLLDFPFPEADEVYAMFQRGHLSLPEGLATLEAEFADWIPTMDQNVWNRVKSNGEISAQEYVLRRRQIFAWMDRLNDRMREYDLLALPTLCSTPPRAADVADIEGYRHHNLRASRNAAVVSLIDLCAVTLPVALDAERMPVGLQLCARRGSDERMVGLALAGERVLGTARERLGTAPLAAD